MKTSEQIKIIKLTSFSAKEIIMQTNNNSNSQQGFRRDFAKMEGDFVVFLIGMRINKFWQIHKWFPVAMAMPKMIKELYSKS